MSGRSAALWLGAFGFAGVVLALLYPDSYQQDAGHHFLQTRWAWTHPSLFVGVWGRPLYTLVYAFPSFLGYPAAKIFTVCLCLVTAWQTAKLAEQHGLERPVLAIPFLFLQPTFLQLSFDTLTEPLCALVLVVALRLHASRRVVAGMAVASLTALVAPWGVILGVVWGVWILLDRDLGPIMKRLPLTLLLGWSVVLWWAAALVITGDPWWIRNDWPREWKTEGRYGLGPWWWYGRQMAVEVLGFIVIPFVAAFAAVHRRRTLAMQASLVVVLFVTLTLMYCFGVFNAAGYSRYLVCVAPCLAVLALAGWNDLSLRLKPVLQTALAAAAIVLSAGYALVYVDSWSFGRDAHAVREMYDWFRANPRPVARLGWSQAYMCILFDTDPWEKLPFAGDREANREILRKAPAGTLVFWDGQTGPAWNHLHPADFQEAGYERLRSQTYELKGLLTRRSRTQEMHLFYKP